MFDLTLNKNFTELDYEKIKTSIKDYYRNDPVFLDYDFDGSITNLIISVLAYNTQYNAFYGNMLAGEFFLDTAQKRESVVSRANEIGYVSRSAQAAKAILNLQIIATSPFATSFTIPRKTIFTTTVAQKTYKFQTLDDYTSTSFVTNDSGKPVFSFSNIEVFEGILLNQKFLIEDANLNGVVVPNKNIDLSRLVVQVKASSSVGSFRTFIRSDNFVDITATSAVYFTEEINDELYRLYFGDGNLGIGLQTGNIVSIEYLATSTSGPNGARVFSLASSIPLADGLSSYTVVQTAQGGAEIESIESIRLNAPKFYGSQNRAVTADDYIAIINKVFPNFKSVVAWGGQDNDPEILGYVFISIKPFDRDYLTNTEKNQIETRLRNDYAVVTVAPIVVDPEFLFLNLSVIVKYDSNVLADGPNALATRVRNAIIQFGSDEIDQFNQYFRSSKLSRIIDASDNSINNNLLTVQIENRIDLAQMNSSGTKFNFRNSIKPGTGRSNMFTYGTVPNHYFLDDGFGNVDLYRINNTLAVLVSNNIGTINYGGGLVNINSLPAQITSTDYQNSILRFYTTPSSEDVYPVRNLILEIDPNGLAVTAIPDTF